MSAARAMVGFLVVAMLLVAGASAMSTSFQDSGQYQAVTNESFEPTGGAVSTLAESDRDDVLYNRSATVYDVSGATDTVASEPEDYTWFEGNGTVLINETGSLAGDSSANISYTYFDSTAEAIRIHQLSSQIPRLFGLLLPLGIVMAFLLALR